MTTADKNHPSAMANFTLPPNNFTTRGSTSAGNFTPPDLTAIEALLPQVFERRIVGAIGIIATLTNLFILVIFFSSKRLLKTSSLLVGLAIAHAFNGVMHGFIGFIPQSDNFIMITSMDCIRLMWPNLFIATYQLLPLLLAVAGLERLVALAAPVWYRKNWTPWRQWLITGSTFVFAGFTLGVNAILAWQNSDQLIPATCVPPMVIGYNYMIYGVHLPAVLSGVSATVCTGIGIHIGRRKIAKMPVTSKGEIGRVNKQIKLTKCLLMISGIDVVCVVIPNLVLILYNFEILDFPLRYTIYAVMVYCSDSVWYILAFVLFNHEFRRTSRKLLHCGKASVEPIDGTTIGHSRFGKMAQSAA